MTQIIIGLGDPNEESAVGILRLLDVVFSESMNVNEKKEIMSAEFGIAMTERLEEGVEGMCNFSEAVLERGVEHGKKQVNTLYQYLFANGKIEDLERAVKEETYLNYLLEECCNELCLT